MGMGMGMGGGGRSSPLASHRPAGRPPALAVQGARMGWLAVAFGFGLSFGVVS